MPKRRAKNYETTNTPAKSVSPPTTSNKFYNVARMLRSNQCGHQEGVDFQQYRCCKKKHRGPQSIGTQIAKNMTALRRSGDFLGDVK